MVDANISRVASYCRPPLTTVPPHAHKNELHCQSRRRRPSFCIQMTACTHTLPPITPSTGTCTSYWKRLRLNVRVLIVRFIIIILFYIQANLLQVLTGEETWDFWMKIPLCSVRRPPLIGIEPATCRYLWSFDSSAHLATEGKETRVTVIEHWAPRCHVGPIVQYPTRCWLHGRMRQCVVVGYWKRLETGCAIMFTSI